MIKHSDGLKKDDKNRMYDVTELPSRGLPYGDKLPGGTVEIYAMTASLQKQLAALGRRSAMELMDKMITSCLRTTSVTPEELVSGDRMYILLFIKIISYPTSKKHLRIFNSKTNDYFETEIDLCDLEVKELDDTWYEPVEVKLPMSGDVVGVRLLRGSDELQALKEARRLRNRKGGSQSDHNMLSTTISQVVSVNGKELLDRDKSDYVEGLLAGDLDVLIEKLNQYDPGPKFEVEVEDPSDGSLIKINLITPQYSFLDPN